MDGPGHQFLAGAAFTEDQNVGRGTRDFLDGRVDLEHFPAFSDHSAEGHRFFQFLHELGVAFLDALFVQRLPDQTRQVFDVEILFDIIIGALFHGGNGRFA